MERAGFEPAYDNVGQIYSLLPLTTRPPLHEVATRGAILRMVVRGDGRRATWRRTIVVSTRHGALLPQRPGLKDDPIRTRGFELERVKGIEPSS